MEMTSKRLFNILMTLALLPCLLGKGNAKVLLGSESCRKLYQVISSTTLQNILQAELQGRRIVAPVTFSLPYCVGSCDKVTYSNYHQLLQDAHHGSNGKHGRGSICQAEGERSVVLIVAESRRDVPTFTYRMLKMPLEITKCVCYPRY